MFRASLGGLAGSQGLSRRRDDVLKGKGSIRARGEAGRQTEQSRLRSASWPARFGEPHPVGFEQVQLPDGGTTAPKGGRLDRDTLNKWMLLPADVLSTALAVTLGVAVFGQDKLEPAVLLPIPLVVVASKIMGLYDRDQHLLRKTTLDEAPALFQLATLYTLLLWLSQPLLVAGLFGRDQVVGLWGLLFVLLVVGRTVARHLARAVAGPERCLIIGHAESAERVRQKIESSFSTSATIVGRVPLEAEGPNGYAPAILGHMSNLPTAIVEHAVDRAIVAPGVSNSEEILQTIRLVKSLGVNVSVLPRLFEVVGSSVEFDDLEGILLLGVRREGLTTSSRFLKRSMDLAGATLGLAVLAPLLAGISVAVKLTSPGPVLFRQRRIGRHGLEFEMLKFRTMFDGADTRKAELLELNEAEGLFKISEDPRLTRVGRFLRRSCLDELPQLVNVLSGQMSLVGPRPLVPDEHHRIDGSHERCLHVRAGMTGLWQIFGSWRIPPHEMVKLDYLYATNWSPWLDLKILLRTLPYALRQRGE
jgi:exopolysaccharide biosynthesis polyprenyl glycosylphosphotransferase